jgi:hypothetical protein
MVGDHQNHASHDYGCQQTTFWTTGRIIAFSFRKAIETRCVCVCMYRKAATFLNGSPKENKVNDLFFLFLPSVASFSLGQLFLIAMQNARRTRSALTLT